MASMKIYLTINEIRVSIGVPDPMGSVPFNEVVRARMWRVAHPMPILWVFQKKSMNTRVQLTCVCINAGISLILGELDCRP